MRNTGMRIEDQWDAYFLGYVCMHSVHQVDSIITDALVATYMEEYFLCDSDCGAKPCPALVTAATVHLSSFRVAHMHLTVTTVAD